jgi:hypothetical protein
MNVTLAAAVVTNSNTTTIDAINDARLRVLGNWVARCFQMRLLNLCFIEVSPFSDVSWCANRDILPN